MPDRSTRRILASSSLSLLLAAFLAAPTVPAQAPAADLFLGDVDVTYAGSKVTSVCVTWFLTIPDDPSAQDGKRTNRDCADKPMANKGTGPISVDEFVVYYVYVYALDTGREFLGKVPCVSLWFEVDGQPGVDLLEDGPFYDTCDQYDLPPMTLSSAQSARELFP